VETFLQITPLAWQDSQSLLTSHQIGRFSPLMTRIEATKIDAMVEESKENLGTDKPAESSTTPVVESPLGKDPVSAEIEFPDFAKVDLRIVKILEADHVEGADKLLRLTLSLGQDASGNEVTRQVFSGIKAAYDPKDLVGMHTVMVANLKPRQMKFGLSEGMILASGDGKEIYLLEPHQGAKPGSRVT
jgi:methionyl-tRNA synthetase